jgi:hypothetical protein
MEQSQTKFNKADFLKRFMKSSIWMIKYHCMAHGPYVDCGMSSIISVYTPMNSSPHSPSHQSKGACVDTGPTTCLSDSSNLYCLRGPKHVVHIINTEWIHPQSSVANGGYTIVAIYATGCKTHI